MACEIQYKTGMLYGDGQERVNCPFHIGLCYCVYREEGIMCGGSSGASMAAAVKAAATLKVSALDTNIL
jgi:cysteine synthase